MVTQWVGKWIESLSTSISESVLLTTMLDSLWYLKSTHNKHMWFLVMKIYLMKILAENRIFFPKMSATSIANMFLCMYLFLIGR